MKSSLFIISTILIYIPFHLFEEAVGNFPKWMYDHKWLPHHMTHGHWMANNIFIYYPLLLLVAMIYFCNPVAFLSCGIAVLFWGVINFGDHFFYTIKDKKISPGLFTGILFLVNSIFGFSFLNFSKLDVYTLILAIIIGIIIFVLPMILSKICYDFLEKYIH